MSDTQSLLAEYIHNGSDTAFRELVDRYISLVYSTAVRLVNGDTHRAEDISQLVFLDLASAAAKLPADVMLGGWLHRHTCFVALNIIRQERRRQIREQEVVEMNSLSDTVDYSSIAPVLDEAINELEEQDRAAIVLRFFEQRDFRSVGQAIGAKEDAARMRVSRALEKLQAILKRRGIAATAAGLSLVLSANAIQAAPVDLAATIAVAAAAVTTAAQTTVALSATKGIAMTTIQKAIIGTAFVALVGTAVFQAEQNSGLRGDLQTLRVTTPQIEQIQREHDDIGRQLDALREENAELKRSSNELRRLRSEVAKLRTDSQELAVLKTGTSPNETIAEALRWQQRVSLLKQRVEQDPSVRIPEMQLLSERDWLSAAQGELKSDKDYRRALSTLRNNAEGKIVSDLFQAASKYAEQNPGRRTHQHHRPAAIFG